MVENNGDLQAAKANLAEAEAEIAELRDIYKQMEAECEDEELWPKLIDVLHRLDTQPDLFVRGFSGTGFGGSSDAIKNGHSVDKSGLPHAQRLARALFKRLAAKERIRFLGYNE